jgi:glycosyltransferase involved in cell wall biosynthesis
MEVGLDIQTADGVKGTETDGNLASLTVCVAICTRNRTELLRRVLDSIVSQTVRPQEILVVDNAPSDTSTEMLVRGRYPEVRYVREERRGLNFARNRALTESAREIVAFIDDDAVAEPGWVAALRDVFAESSQIAVCTGKVVPYSLETEGQRLFEANGGFSRGDRRIRLPADRGGRLNGLFSPLIALSINVGVGCNLAVRRRTILESGGFDEAMDQAPVLPGGGDLDLLWRMLDAGHEIVYEPSARMSHEHRRDVADVVDQIVEHSHGLIAMLVKAAFTARSLSRISILMFLSWRLIKPGFRLARRAVGRDPLSARILLRVWWNCWRALGSYGAARRQAERGRETDNA